MEREQQPYPMIDVLNEEGQHMPTIMAVTDLGPNNLGSIGPDNPESVKPIVEAAESPEYHKKPSRRFVCVDGRGKDDAEVHNADEADPQVAGGLAITLGNAKMMITESPAPLSKITASTTKEIVDAKYEVVVHGDDVKEKEGCTANVKQREVLRFNGENSDIIAPIVWNIAEAMDLDEHGVRKDDVVELLTTGKSNADNDSLWDVTPSQNIDIAIDNGASYEERSGKHVEQIEVVTTDEDHVFDNQQFAEDYAVKNGQRDVESFAAALGTAKKAIFEIEDIKGGTKLDAARLTLGAIAYNVGASKLLKNDNMPVVVFAKG